jgi:hypothetical protein
MSHRSREGHDRRVQKLKVRIASAANDHLLHCTVSDPVTGKACGRPTARAAKQGLSAFVCRHHQAHLQRHGSTWCKSPAAPVLKQYIRLSLALIDGNRRDPFVNAALSGLQGIMDASGPTEIATRLRGLAPERRAKIALARLREANIKPERLLAIALAVSALIEANPAVVHRTREWRIVAIAKAAHRLASGYHRVWEVQDENGDVSQRTEMHAYPRSSGRVLRYLGEIIEKECELVIDHHLSAVLTLKVTREGPATAAGVIT